VSVASERWKRLSVRFLTGFFVLNFVLIEVAGLVGWAFTEIPGGRIAGMLVTAAVFSAALLALNFQWQRSAPFLRSVAVAAALLFTARFHIERVASNWYSQVLLKSPADSTAGSLARLVVFLRELSAAQEQYRLRQESYAPSIDSLLAWVSAPPKS
jgi:hypothetical protein